MNSAGIWMFGFAFAYMALLIGMSQIARRRSQSGADFFVGGRSFSRWTVGFCVAGFFSGSTYISILELSYLTGISAIWYGVAEMTHLIIIGLVVLGPFRDRMTVTMSGLIGDTYGRAARGIAGIITAFAFPMWSVATAAAFASCITALTGLDILISISITAALMYIFLTTGGMFSLAMTQTANFFVSMMMFGVIIYAIIVGPGWGQVFSLLTSETVYGDLKGVGLQVIVAWFGTFVVNALLAQAAFQMALGCKTPKEGRQGVFLAVGYNFLYIFFGVVVGAAAAVALPGESRGMVAIPKFIMETVPAPLTGLFTLGIWACALGWAAPCQFSGATSLGKDFGFAVNPKATDATLIKYARWSLLIMTIMMVVFGYLRSEQAAWWNIFAWTNRNGATFGPVLAALCWSAATPRGAVCALLLGWASGMLWNALGGWAINQFFLGIHPVWIAMTINIMTLTVVSLAQPGWSLLTLSSNQRFSRMIIGVSALCVTGYTALAFQALHSAGLIGMFVFISVMLLWVVIMLSTERRKGEGFDLVPEVNLIPATE